MNDDQQALLHLGVALTIGLLVGVERGWEARDAGEGHRIAGVRTYGLLAFLGGGAALLSQYLGALILAFVFAAVAATLIAAYVITYLHQRDAASITSLIAGFLTFVFGAFAGTGQVTVAAASAVVITLVLSYKPLLHRWLRALKGEELRAGLKLLLISVVLLPILPDEGYGPWQSLNPYEVWWMVVLIAAISFAGYFAIKIGGERRGAAFTGLFGGLAASTAVTLHFSRLASQRPASTVTMLAMGTLLACSIMFPRMLLIASLLNVELLALLVLPAVVMALCLVVPAAFYWRSPPPGESGTETGLKNPLELKTALSFGALLVAVMLLGKALKTVYGEAGVLVLAAASGIADVDAITLSLSRMSVDDLSLAMAATGIVVAAAVNNAVKAGMAAVLGGSGMGTRVGLPLVVSAAAGIVAAWLWIWQ